MASPTINVVLADDSSIVCRLLSDILADVPDIEVVGEANDGAEAVALVAEESPDLLVLDLIMPKMDGLATLRALMEDNPLPVLVLTSLGPRSVKAFKAIKLGALEVMEKPTGIQDAEAQREFRDLLVERIRAVARVKVKPRAPRHRPELIIPEGSEPTFDLIAIGSSSGGPAALSPLLVGLTPQFPVSVVVVQHLARALAPSFVEWLRKESGFMVSLADDGDRVMPGVLSVAAPGSHLTLREGHFHLQMGEPVQGKCPSIDVFFRSVAQDLGPRAAAVLLSGTGHDGAEGLAEIREAGGTTLVQSPDTALASELIEAALERDGKHVCLPAEDMSPVLLQACFDGARTTSPR